MLRKVGPISRDRVMHECTSPLPSLSLFISLVRTQLNCLCALSPLCALSSIACKKKKKEEIKGTAATLAHCIGQAAECFIAVETELKEGFCEHDFHISRLYIYIFSLATRMRSCLFFCCSSCAETSSTWNLI